MGIRDYPLGVVKRNKNLQKRLSNMTSERSNICKKGKSKSLPTSERSHICAPEICDLSEVG
jgi:hypothetical protein